MVATRYPVDPTLIAPLSVEKYHRMIDAGVFDEDDRLELLEGVLVEMSPQGSRHTKFITRFINMMIPLVGPAYRVRAQAPLTLPPFGEPEPDISIVTQQVDEAAERHPQTALLVVEVAATSLQKDRLIKSRVYARAGIAEYWIADVEAQCIEVYRDPDRSDARYRLDSVVPCGEEIIPLAFPAVRLSVSALFGA